MAIKEPSAMAIKEPSTMAIKEPSTIKQNNRQNPMNKTSKLQRISGAANARTLYNFAYAEQGLDSPKADHSTPLKSTYSKA